LSRTVHDDDIAVVKANSTCHNLIPELINNASPSRALFLYSSLADHLVSMHKGKRIEIYNDLYFETFRHDLVSQGIIDSQDIASLTPVEKIILMWLARVMCVLDCFAQEPGIRLRTLDFHSFINSPQTLLPLVARQLGIHTTEADIERVVASDLMNREAKLGNRQYDARQREQEKQTVYEQHRETIESGLRWARQFIPDTEYLERLPHTLESTD
jgi:hypothetical protein